METGKKCCRKRLASQMAELSVYMAIELSPQPRGLMVHHLPARIPDDLGKSMKKGPPNN